MVLTLGHLALDPEGGLKVLGFCGTDARPPGTAERGSGQRKVALDGVSTPGPVHPWAASSSPASPRPCLSVPGISNAEARQPGKAPNFSVNWTVGDSAIEVINATTGKDELGRASRLCKHALYCRWMRVHGKVPAPPPRSLFHKAPRHHPHGLSQTSLFLGTPHLEAWPRLLSSKAASGSSSLPAGFLGGGGPLTCTCCQVIPPEEGRPPRGPQEALGLFLQ